MPALEQRLRELLESWFGETVVGMDFCPYIIGRLEEEGVCELLRTCDAIEGEFVLDLTGLRSADPGGIEAIQKLVRAGRKLRGASPFIRLLLYDQQPADAE